MKDAKMKKTVIPMKAKLRLPLTAEEVARLYARIEELERHWTKDELMAKLEKHWTKEKLIKEIHLAFLAGQEYQMCGDWSKPSLASYTETRLALHGYKGDDAKVAFDDKGAAHSVRNNQ